MRKLLSIDDIVDVLHKTKQRGLGFILSKLNFIGLNRTMKTFNQSDYQSADWWIIPKVRKRWNFLITGNEDLEYKEFLVDNFLKDASHLRLISLGSGSCHHEIELAKYSNFEEIICIDIAKDRIQKAQAIVDKLKLKNIKLICADVYKYDVPKEYFDIAYFHASLHHFDNIDSFVENKIKKSLKPKGLLIINEFVGPTRLQFPKHQIKKINEALKIIPEAYKSRYKSNLKKRKYHGPGILRMIIADPSECIDSQSIMPAIHSNFDKIIEKPYGGNILMNVLKDISHHFTSLDSKKNEVLEKLFLFEDEYLTKHSSDFVFGIYQKKI